MIQLAMIRSRTNRGGGFDRRKICCSLAALFGIVASILITGCHSAGKLPDKSSQAYADFVSTFYVGLAALQVGDDVRAESELSRATKIIPSEPAAWADWGILALRQRNFDAAEQRLTQARSLSPQNDSIYYLLGLDEAASGKTAQAIENYRKAVSLNPKNVQAIYQLATEVERQGGADSDGEFQKLTQQILQQEPGNLATQLELARIAAKRGDAATLKEAVAAIREHAQAWPPEVQQQLATLENAAAGPDPHGAAIRTAFLRNVLMRVSDFRQSLAVIKPPPGEEAHPFTRFLRLENPVDKPAPADAAMMLTPTPIEGQPDNTQPDKKWNWIGAIALSDAGSPVIVAANGSEVHFVGGASVPFPGGANKQAPGPEGVVPVDFNYDFKTDLVLAGAGGVRFLRQDNPGNFSDVTLQTKLSKQVLNASYTGAWAVDIDADGDLDIVLGSIAGSVVVLRNNGDGSFTSTQNFAGVSGVRGFVWADLNGDGNPDASIIDGSGLLHVFLNERGGHFREINSPVGIEPVKTIAAADVNHDGVLDLLAAEKSSAIVGLSFNTETTAWNCAEIARVPDASMNLDGEVRLRAADLDNNGAVDLMLAHTALPMRQDRPGALVWLGDDKGGFAPPVSVNAARTIFDVADLDSKGRLDLLGISSDGKPVRIVNRGTRNYHWQIIRPRARQATGDQRINSFGIGGEIEIRSGMLLQMQPIDGPQMHFGLGDHTRVDVARILWPNGSARAEFALQADHSVVTEQRLKGSCPFLFAWNGGRMEFVKDAVPWGSAIGLRINSLGTASIAATEEWYKIGREQLAAHDGYYDLRITGELWETYYYDYLALMAVDHPAGTEIFTDERFVVPAPKPAVITVGPVHKILRATDDNGHDVTSTVLNLDDNYLDSFGRGQYQGITRDHYVEVDLGDLPATGPIYLIAKGWVHPSDSSINLAISQGGHEPARGLSIEVLDPHGKWVTAESNLGFPAGRKKTCLLNISNIFRAGTPRVLRLRTNLEIYWDSIEWAQGLPEEEMKITRINPSVADLHYRGYSAIHQANPSSPEIPDYHVLASTTQPWRDLAGFYTRYGDVRELLSNTDDRYVIMNAGDELALRFTALPNPPAGWVRDYVIAGDGWIKDGDYNTTYSQTVLPLPHHDRKAYQSSPGRLEDEWTFQHHPEDWQIYHTRYVTPDVFKNALRNELSTGGNSQ